MQRIANEKRGKSAENLTAGNSVFARMNYVPPTGGLRSHMNSANRMRDLRATVACLGVHGAENMLPFEKQRVAPRRKSRAADQPLSH